MSNVQLIKSAHIWAVAVVLFGAIALAVNAGSNPTHSAQQNSNNSNANTNTSRNQNQNQNANLVTNRNGNSNNSNATAEAAPAGTGALSNRDSKFIMDTAMAGLMEVELGRWASQKGTAQEVKDFGKRMVDDHLKANTELATLASSKGVTLPTELDEKHQRNVSKVARLTGADFDRAYSKLMLKDHESVVKDFEKQSTNADDADIKAFAAKMLPGLQEHLQMARGLPGNTKPASSNANSNGNSNN